MNRLILVSLFVVLSTSAARALSLEESQSVVREFVRAATPLKRAVIPDFNGAIDVRTDWPENYPSASSGDDGITVTGGLLRLPYMTSDAVALILCHELGHDQAVTRAYVGRDKVFSGEEIMADYFAGTCFPRLLLASHVLANSPRGSDDVTLSPRLVQKCQVAFPDPTAAAICFRQAKASMAFIEFLYRELFRSDYDANGLEAPSFDRPWRGEKDFMQCRLINLENEIFHTAPVACRDEG